MFLLALVSLVQSLPLQLEGTWRVPNLFPHFIDMYMKAQEEKQLALSQLSHLWQGQAVGKDAGVFLLPFEIK